jgi:hypothetical protein
LVLSLRQGIAARSFRTVLSHDFCGSDATHAKSHAKSHAKTHAKSRAKTHAKTHADTRGERHNRADHESKVASAPPIILPRAETRRPFSFCFLSFCRFLLALTGYARLQRTKLRRTHALHSSRALLAIAQLGQAGRPSHPPTPLAAQPLEA